MPKHTTPEAAPPDTDEVTVLRSTPVAARPRPVRRPARPRPRPQGRRLATRVADPGSPLPPGAGPGARIQAPVPTGRRRGAHGVRRRPPRPLFMLLGAIVVLLTAGIAAYGVLNAGFFRVTQVEVAGAQRVDEQEIAWATGALDRDLFLVDPESVRRRVEGLSGVRRAEVSLIWPRRLIVTVEERTPAAVWWAGGARYVVDAGGTVLDFPPDPALPVIYQIDGSPGFAPGDRVDADAVALVTRLRDTAPAQLGQNVTRFEWTQRTGLEVVTDRGVRVRLGDNSNIEYKLAVWRGILDQARRDRTAISEIDLRFGDRVVYR